MALDTTIKGYEYGKETSTKEWSCCSVIIPSAKIIFSVPLSPPVLTVTVELETNLCED